MALRLGHRPFKNSLRSFVISSVGFAQRSAQRGWNAPVRSKQRNHGHLCGGRQVVDSPSDRTLDDLFELHANHFDGAWLSRPYTSSNRTMSSSPKYDPDCTSM